MPDVWSHDKFTDTGAARNTGGARAGAGKLLISNLDFGVNDSDINVSYCPVAQQPTIFWCFHDNVIILLHMLFLQNLCICIAYFVNCMMFFFTKFLCIYIAYFVCCRNCLLNLGK